MKYNLKTLLFLLLSTSLVQAQVGINTTNSAPDPSSMLDVKSNNKGILIPRMTTAQKNAITNKADGLLVYDTDMKQFSYWKNFGTTTAGFWQDFGNLPTASANFWNNNANDINNINIGNVGIGTTTPTAKLEVNSGQPNISGLKLTQLANTNLIDFQNIIINNVNSPSGITKDADGNIYVTSLLTHTILKFNNEGQLVPFVLTGEAINYPYNIIIGPDNNLYVANYGNNSIIKITQAGVASYFVLPTAGLSQPIGLAFDFIGNLYVVNNANGVHLAGFVSKIAPNGNITNLAFNTGLSNPFYCIIKPNANTLLVGNINQGDNQIIALDLSNNGAKTFFKTGLTGSVTGMAANENGKIYLSHETENKISEMDINGNITKIFDTPEPKPLLYKDNQLYYGNFSAGKLNKLSFGHFNNIGINSKGEIGLANNNNDFESLTCDKIDNLIIPGSLGEFTIIKNWVDVEKNGLGTFDNTNGTYTVKKSGLYQLNFSVKFEKPANIPGFNFVQAKISKNIEIIANNLYAWTDSPNPYFSLVTVNKQIRFKGGDIIKISLSQAFNSQGWDMAASAPHFSLHFIHP